MGSDPGDEKKEEDVGFEESEEEVTVVVDPGLRDKALAKDELRQPDILIDDSPTRPVQPIQRFAATLPSADEFSDEASLGGYLESMPEDARDSGLYTNLSEILPRPTDLDIKQTPPRVPPNLRDQVMEEASVQTAPTQSWRSLHPASLVVNLIPQGWRTLRSLWPLLLALFVSGEGLGMRFLDLFVVLIFFGLSLWNTFIHWVTLRYRVHENRLEIMSGLLNRQARTIDPARIQNMEMVQNVFHTWTGLVELRIETAGDQSTEGLLSALSVDEAMRLRGVLAEVGSLSTSLESHDEADEVLVKMTVAEILAYGLTQRTIGTVAVITAIGLEVLTQMGPQTTREMAVVMQPRVVVAAFLLAFAASWAVSAVASLLRHHQFRLVRMGDALRTESGLLTRRKVEIPLSKVQLVRVDESLVRRLMGFGTLLIETAGLGVTEGRVQQAEGMVPMVAEDQLYAVASAASPRTSIDPWTASLHPAHPRALYRSSIASLVQSTVLAVPLFILLESARWAIPAIFVVGLWSAWLDWKKQGWLITDTAIVSRRGFFVRRTWIIARDKLQSVHEVQGPFMRLHGLSRLVIRVAGSQISLPDTGVKDTRRVMAELTASAMPS